MIDIHSHFFPAFSQAEASQFGQDFPWLAAGDDGSGHIMKGDTPFRPIQPSLWNVDARVRDLDAQGVDLQIICATPILFGYDLNPHAAADAATAMNQLALTFCERAPTRFKSLCQVPLQDLDLACKELERAMSAGHVGVQIGNHVGERDMDDAELIEFLQHCANLEAPVFVHPWDMFARERMDRYMLQWLVGMPAETNLSILYLILSGAFERLPASLRICFAHGGGSFAYTLGRVENAWQHRDIVRQDCPNPPSSYVDRFYTDSLVFDRKALDLLLGTMSSQRVMFGTDQPFPLGEQEPGSLIKDHSALDAAERVALLDKNATHFFALNGRDEA